MGEREGWKRRAVAGRMVSGESGGIVQVFCCPTCRDSGLVYVHLGPELDDYIAEDCPRCLGEPSQSGR